ncbi:MAG TPA: YaeQ family protein [Kofleriaceae bacterium]|nr:YaeQ family protein [Kofleriaceae bacterium]
MALPATLRRFEIALADADRAVYEQLDWRVAQHPSESERFLVARVIARALEHGEGVEFSRGGVSDDDEPAIVQRDLRGDLQAWIEVGSPSPERLHKATKLAPRVVVYAWKNVEQLAEAIAERGVHRADELALRALSPELLDAIAATLDRVNRWELSVSGGALYLAIGAAQLEGTVLPVAIPA